MWATATHLDIARSETESAQRMATRVDGNDDAVSDPLPQPSMVNAQGRLSSILVMVACRWRV
jgi:hypothetical protein